MPWYLAAHLPTGRAFLIHALIGYCSLQNESSSKRSPRVRFTSSLSPNGCVTRGHLKGIVIMDRARSSGREYLIGMDAKRANKYLQCIILEEGSKLPGDLAPWHCPRRDGMSLIMSMLINAHRPDAGSWSSHGALLNALSRQGRENKHTRSFW